jgi:peptide deformylase
MKIVYYPDPILMSPCAPVVDFTPIPALITDMTTIMNSNNGIGLAANQVGHSIKLFIIKDKQGKIHSFVNPSIIDTDRKVIMQEGCLSAPGIYLNIERPAAIQVAFQNELGEHKKIIAEGLEARTILHEYDHILGTFYFSKVNRAIRKRAIAEMRKNES